MKKIEQDDIMHCFDMLLINDNLKCYVSDLTCDTLSGACAGIDERSSQVLAYYTLLLNNFIDNEVVVRIQPDWMHPSTKETINAKQWKREQITNLAPSTQTTGHEQISHGPKLT